VRIHSRVGVELGRKLIAEAVLIGALKNCEGLILLLPVDADDSVLQADVVARHTHHPLDHVVRWIQRKMEHNHVAPPHGLVGQQPLPDAGLAVDRFVHQQKVADQQRALHGFRGDAKGLHDKGEHKERYDDDGQQRAKGVEQVGKDQVGVMRGPARDRRHGNSGSNDRRFFRSDAEELCW